MPKKYKKAITASLIIIMLVAGAELAARYVLGLGDPPLYISHPTIECMLKPYQELSRFGNNVFGN